MAGIKDKLRDEDWRLVLTLRAQGIGTRVELGIKRKKVHQQT